MTIKQGQVMMLMTSVNEVLTKAGRQYGTEFHKGLHFSIEYKLIKLMKELSKIDNDFATLTREMFASKGIVFGEKGEVVFPETFTDADKAEFHSWEKEVMLKDFEVDFTKLTMADMDNVILSDCPNKAMFIEFCVE